MGNISGFRFVQAAARIGIPIAAVNLGWTRAVDLTALKVEDRYEAALPFLPVACRGVHCAQSPVGLKL